MSKIDFTKVYTRLKKAEEKTVESVLGVFHGILADLREIEAKALSAADKHRDEAKVALLNEEAAEVRAVEARKAQLAILPLVAKSVAPVADKA